MQTKHEQAYSRKGISKKTQYRIDKDKLTQEIAEADNNIIKGQNTFECEVLPNSANQKSAKGVNAEGETHVLKGRLKGLHDHFMDWGVGTEEQMAIQNGCHPWFNTNTPGMGESIASNGSTILMAANNREGPAKYGNTRNLRAYRISSPSSIPIAGIPGDFPTASDGGWARAGAGTLLPNNPSSNRVMGKEFVVNGVKYLSLPADDAAAKAQALRDSANAAGQGEYLSGTKGKWDGSDTGREWVAQNIYLPMLELSPSTYPDPEREANSLASRLATNNESFWSSWFFRRCYEAYWTEERETRAKGLDPSTVFDYTAKDGIKLRQKIEADPDSFIGQNVFVAFRNTEAPVFVGDAIWNQRLSTPNTIEGAAAGTAAHMKVITREAGGQYRAIGGNEGKYSTVNDVPVEVDADKLLTGRAKTLYAVVYKRVTVVGSEGGGETMASN